MVKKLSLIYGVICWILVIITTFNYVSAYLALIIFVLGTFIIAFIIDKKRKQKEKE